MELTDLTPELILGHAATCSVCGVGDGKPCLTSRGFATAPHKKRALKALRAINRLEAKASADSSKSSSGQRRRR